MRTRPTLTIRAQRTAPAGSPLRARRRALTLIELCIGMLVTTMVLGALSAMWFAVAHVWNTSTASQGVALTGNLAAVRLESTFRAAKYLCQYNVGSVDGKTTPAASIFFWKGDAWTTHGAVRLRQLGP